MATYSGTTDINFSSPSSISRLLNLYSTGKKMKRTKPKPMREALDTAEGLQVFNSSSEDESIGRLKTDGWDGTVSFAQRQFQERHSPHFISDLRPTATLLRTKRSKRCKTCRTLLSKPEPKVSTNRYKIKVLALNNVPKVLSRALNAPATSLSHPLVASSAIQLQAFDYYINQPAI
jgi:dynactin-4